MLSLSSEKRLVSIAQETVVGFPYWLLGRRNAKVDLFGESECFP